MKLSFERWIEQQRLTRDASLLFEEAVICYRARAYRAALTLSYLGFFAILRRRVLDSGPPPGAAQDRWEANQRRVSDDDTRDRQLFDLIQQQQPSPVFAIPPQLRVQVTYWRDRRNACAHAKDEAIDHAHVDAFWLFLRSNLGKLVVIGGRDSIINRVRAHFDLSLTPRGADRSALVADLPLAVVDTELKDLLHEVDMAIIDARSTLFEIRDDDALEFFDELVRSDHARTGTAFVEVLKEDEGFMGEFLQRFPQQVVLFRDDPTVIRRLWFKPPTGLHSQLRVYAALVAHDLVPKDQLREANNRIGDELKGQVPHEADLPALEACGLLAELKKRMIDKLSDYGWANLNSAFVCWHIGRYPLDEDLVKAIQDAFTSDTHHFPWHAARALDALFADNDNKRTEYRELSAALGLSAPNKIASLCDGLP